MHHYNKDPGYWRQFTEEKLEAIMTLQNVKDQEYWDTWIKIYSKLFGGK